MTQVTTETIETETTGTETTETPEATVEEYERPKFNVPKIEVFEQEYLFLTEHLKFDRHKAPETLENQSVLIDLAGEFLNKASRQFNAIKLMLEVREAEIEVQIRREAEAVGKKTTEKSIESELKTHPEIIALKHAKNDAEDVRNLWLNRKTAYESRGRDLHDEVQLIVCGYSNVR